MELRQSHGHEIKDITKIHLEAFDETEGPIVSELAKNILNDKTAEPRLTIVAEKQNELLGHVLFTKLEIETDKYNLNARILAPLAVRPKVMKKGIGSKLVKQGCEQLKNEGVELILVYGDPKYYSRFGFKPAKPLGLLPSHPIPKEYEEAWMVMNLANKTFQKMNCKVKCCQALDDPKFW